MVERSILLVEDEPLVARGLRGVLRRFGTVAIAGNVREGLELVERLEEVRALVVDEGLPDGSGFRVVDAARQRWPAVPIVIVTGQSGSEVADGAFDRRILLLRKSGGSELRRLVEYIEQAQSPGGADAFTRRSVVAERWTKRYQLTEAHKALLIAGIYGVHRRDLADHLGIEEDTVKQHVRGLLARLSVDPNLRVKSYEEAVRALVDEAG